MANNVRQAVVEKWLEGKALKPDADEPHVFVFRGYNHAGEHHFIQFQPPYRRSLRDDGRMAFTVEVWVNSRKKLNFEWDSDGRYQLRGFTKGEWFSDVADWSLISEEEMAERKRVA